MSAEIALTYGFLFIEKAAMSEITWLLFFHSFEQLLFYEKKKFLKKNSKSFLSVKMLHNKMKTGTNLALTRRFSNSNGIWLSWNKTRLNKIEVNTCFYLYPPRPYIFYPLLYLVNQHLYQDIQSLVLTVIKITIIM